MVRYKKNEVTKQRITSYIWDEKFNRLLELGVDFITANGIMDKYYIISKQNDKHEEYFGV
jgi:hypothetical protein